MSVVSSSEDIGCEVVWVGEDLCQFLLSLHGSVRVRVGMASPESNCGRLVEKSVRCRRQNRIVDAL